MEFVTERGDVVGALQRGEDGADERILYQLKSVELNFRKVVEEGVAVVKVRGDKGVGKEDGCVVVKGGAGLTKKSDVVKGMLDDRRNVF